MVSGFEDDWSDVRVKVDPMVYATEGTTTAGSDFNQAWEALQGDRVVWARWVDDQDKELSPTSEGAAEPEGNGMAIKTLTFVAEEPVTLMGLNLYTKGDFLVLTHRFPQAVNMVKGDAFQLGPFMISFS